MKALEAALGSSAISVSCQSSEMHQEVHKPTRIHASERLDIEAENGELTQTQIKAGIVHAVFTDNLVLKTLANEKWSKQSGGSASFGFGDLAGMLKSATISNIDAGSFEKIIDDFASMVGEKEFYLKVGNVLRSESAFVGHMNHDPKHEYKSAKITQIEKVKQGQNTWNNNFDFSAGGLMTVIGALGNSDRNESVEQNISDEDTFVEEDFIDREYGNEVRNDVKDSVKSDIKDKVKDSAKIALKSKLVVM